MTRWKRENPDTLVLMHSHNLWSKWYQHLTDACYSLGFPMTTRRFENHFDGSIDQIWIIPRGLRPEVEQLARKLQLQSWGEYSE